MSVKISQSQKVTCQCSNVLEITAAVTFQLVSFLSAAMGLFKNTAIEANGPNFLKPLMSIGILAHML